MDIENYSTAHIESCSGGCGLLRVDQDALAKLLHSSRIPLIDATKLKSQPSSPILPRRQRDKGKGRGSKYIAFSHVWTDGRGNLHDNAMPLCQLQDLADVTMSSGLELNQNVEHFWIDTLCIPPDEVRSLASAQKIGLHTMRDVYERASAVVVLDKWLENTSTTGLSSIELLSRIVACPWTSRLWTLQEGRLNAKLYFRFNDRLVDSDLIEDQFMTQIGNGPYPDWFTWFQEALWMEALAHHGRLRFTTHSAKADQGFIEDLILDEATLHAISLCMNRVSLYHRSTSVATDEALCLAVLMNFDIKELTQVAPESRMLKFWCMFKELPPHVLYWVVPRMTDKGFSWASKTLMYYQSMGASQGETFDRDSVGRNRVKRLHEGLLVEAPAIVFAKTTAESLYLPLYNVTHRSHEYQINSQLLATIDPALIEEKDSWHCYQCLSILQSGGSR